jgi:hypothetical protein
MFRGGPLTDVSFPKFLMWKLWPCLQFELTRRRVSPKYWGIRVHSKNLFRNISKVRVGPISKKFNVGNITGGMLRRTLNFVKEFERNTSQTIYGFRYVPDAFLNDALMRSVPSSKGLNIFFRHL